MGGGGWESRGMFRGSIHYALFEAFNISRSGGDHFAGGLPSGFIHIP
jgi:hypothetical protein